MEQMVSIKSNMFQGLLWQTKVSDLFAWVSLDNHKRASKKRIKATNKGNQRTKKTSGVRWSVFKHVHRGRFSLAWFPEQTRLVLTQWQIVQAKDGRVWLLATNILQSQPLGLSFLTNSILSPIHELQNKGDSSKRSDTHCQFTKVIAPKTIWTLTLVDSECFCGYFLAYSKFLIDFAAFVCELERKDGVSLAKRRRPVFGSKLDRPSLPCLACKSHLVLLADLTSPCQT